MIALEFVVGTCDESMMMMVVVVAAIFVVYVGEKLWKKMGVEREKQVADERYDQTRPVWQVKRE